MHVPSAGLGMEIDDTLLLSRDLNGLVGKRTIQMLIPQCSTLSQGFSQDAGGASVRGSERAWDWSPVGGEPGVVSQLRRELQAGKYRENV